MNQAVVFAIVQTGARANGGLQSITEVMRRLRTHRPVILTNLDSELSKHWRSLGMDVHIAAEEASTGFRRDPLGVIRTYRRYHRTVAALLAASGARVVHANDPLAFQLCLTGAKRAGAHIALNVRDTLDPGRRPPRHKYRTLFAAADHVFYLSNDMAERWRQVAPNATRSFSVTYSIVDSQRFARTPVPTDGRPVVLVPGVFWPKKGQLEFIRNVVPALAERGVETWFAGDFEPRTNPYAAGCAIAAEPFSDCVKFLGFRSDVPKLLQQSWVVAVPSLHEGLMRGMIEAMSCGRPVVSFDVSSAREVLEDKSSGAGVVVQGGDHAGLAAALLSYVDDEAARVAAGEAASAAARVLFDAEQVTERYERIYRELSKA